MMSRSVPGMFAIRVIVIEAVPITPPGEQGNKQNKQPSINIGEQKGYVDKIGAIHFNTNFK